MTKDQVVLGAVYTTKVGGKSAEVRVDSENGKRGWNATAVATGKPVRVKDARDLKPIKADDEADAGNERGGSGDAGPQPPKPRKRAATAKRAATPMEPKDKPLSCLDAAAQVLKSSGSPMNCKSLIDAMREQKLWTSDAPTPAATLSSAILREMKKGTASRFRKVDRGQFAFNEPKGE